MKPFTVYRSRIPAAIALLGPLFLAPMPLVCGKPLANASAETADLPKSALELYDQATAAFASGNYMGAVEALKRAVAIDPNPLLVFNLAQAERMAGHCEAALAQYESFLKSSDPAEDADLRRQAEQHAVSLRVACLAPPLPDVPAQPASRAVEPGPKEVSQAGGGGHLATSLCPPPLQESGKWVNPLLALGASALISGGSLLLWNDARKDHWSTADRLLQDQRTAGISNATQFEDQRANDRLLKGIQAVNVLSISLAVAGAIVSMAAAAAWFTNRTSPGHSTAE